MHRTRLEDTLFNLMLDFPKPLLKRRNLGAVLLSILHNPNHRWPSYCCDILLSAKCVVDYGESIMCRAKMKSSIFSLLRSGPTGYTLCNFPLHHYVHEKDAALCIQRLSPPRVDPTETKLILFTRLLGHPLFGAAISTCLLLFFAGRSVAGSWQSHAESSNTRVPHGATAELLPALRIS